MSKTKLTLNEFSSAIKNIKTEMDKLCSPDEPNYFPIYDGPINNEQYFHSFIKIVWVLKEAYTETNENGERGGEDYGDGFFIPDDIYAFIRSQPSKKTWAPIAYTSYSILNGFLIYNDLADLDEEPFMAQAINQVAVVNTKKMPGTSRSKMKEIEAAFEESKDLLSRQLQLLSPDIVIGGNTLYMYLKMFGLSEPTGLTPIFKRPYYVKDGRLFIDAYHPARIGSPFNYVDDIVLVAKEWFQQYQLTQP